MQLGASYLNRPVRIVNAGSNRVLYAHSRVNWTDRVGAGTNARVTEDGNWLVHLTAHGYRFTNALSHRVLYAARDFNDKKRFGAGWPENEVHHDGYWNILQNPDGSYCIVNKDSNRCLYAHPGAEWEQRVGARSPAHEVNAEGRWYFIFSPMVANDEEP